MCAAISACLSQQDFEHIHDTSKTGTTNKLYEAWVNQIDIRELLKTGDLKSGVLNFVAGFDDHRHDRIRRPHSLIADESEICLPESHPFLDADEPARASPTHSSRIRTRTPNEFVTYHADRLRFELVNPRIEPTSPMLIRSLVQ